MGENDKTEGKPGPEGQRARSAFPDEDELKGDTEGHIARWSNRDLKDDIEALEEDPASATKQDEQASDAPGNAGEVVQH